MNRLREPEELENADREISLGMPTILGIFFALALLCACFFGFGYTMGRKSVPSAAVAVSADPIPGLAAAAAKPAAGSPAESYPASPPPSPQVPGSAVVVLNGAAPSAPPAAKNVATPADGLIAGDRIPPAVPQPSGNNQQLSTAFMVQVAAVSSQDVANIELAALKKDGYDVVVRHEPQDQLLHVQIGPFATRKDAEAMRQRVIADGFNAIVK